MWVTHSRHYENLKKRQKSNTVLSLLWSCPLLVGLVALQIQCISVWPQCCQPNGISRILLLWAGCRLSFSLLQSSILSIRGARSASGNFVSLQPFACGPGNCRVTSFHLPLTISSYLFLSIEFISILFVVLLLMLFNFWNSYTTKNIPDIITALQVLCPLSPCHSYKYWLIGKLSTNITLLLIERTGRTRKSSWILMYVDKVESFTLSFCTTVSQSNNIRLSKEYIACACVYGNFYIPNFLIIIILRIHHFCHYYRCHGIVKFYGPWRDILQEKKTIEEKNI